MVGEQPNGGFFLQVSGDTLSFQTYNQDWPAAASQPNSITTLHALSSSDGAPRWRSQWQGGSITGAVLQGQSLYFETSQVPSTGNPQSLQVEIVALNAQTGTTRWATLVKLLDGTEKTPTPPPHNVDPGFFSCKIREETQQESGLKCSITEVYSTVSHELWRQRGCYVIWNGQPFTT